MNSLLQDRYVSQNLLQLLPIKAYAILSQLSTLTRDILSYIDWRTTYSAIVGYNVLEYTKTCVIWDGDKDDQEMWRQLCVRASTNGSDMTTYFRHSLEFAAVFSTLEDSSVSRTNVLIRTVLVGLPAHLVRLVIASGPVDKTFLLILLTQSCEFASKEVLQVLYKECIKFVGRDKERLTRNVLLETLEKLRARFNSCDIVYITGTKSSLR